MAPGDSTAFAEWLDAIQAGEGFYLACEHGHATVPPRERCPRCGGTLEDRPLPQTGTVIARTVVHVPTPRFEGLAPYATAVVEAGPLRLTGLLVDADPASVDRGDLVEIGAGRPAADAPRCVTISPP